jgi:adenosylmethionine-8-amino-7-oxononanoate aminotransferase
MTGWGRTGELFAMNHCNDTPDIVCLSKGLTGGVLPLGLTVAKQHIYDAFLDDDTLKALLHGHSYTGNPLACAAGCASIELFHEPKTKENIDFISNAHGLFKVHLEQQNLPIKEVRHCGTIIAIEIETGENSSYFSSIRVDAIRHFLANGMLLRPLGNVIFLNPPYCIGEEELNTCYEAIEGFLTGLR